MSNQLVIINFFVLLALALLLAILPLLTRSRLFFAVTVTPEFAKSDAGRSILHGYLVRLAGAAGIVIVVAIVVAQISSATSNLMNVIMVPVFIVLAVAAYLWAYRRTRAHAVAPGPINVALNPPTFDIWPHPRWLISLPYVILLVSSVWLTLHWQNIPARFPVHFDQYGNPNGWSTRSIPGVYGILFIGCAVCLLSNAIMLIGRYVRRLPQTATRVRAINWVIVEMTIGIALMFGLLSQLALYGPVMTRGNWLSVTISCIVAAIIIVPAVTFWMMVRNKGNSPVVPDTSDRTPDDCWKWGIIYINPADPAVFVERRFGVGYTLNLGRPAAWLALGLIIAILIAALLIAHT